MPTLVDVPNVGEVEFPDGMTDEQIASAIQSNFPKASEAPAAKDEARPAKTTVVDVPNVGEVEFPAEMKDDEIAAAILKNFPNATAPTPSLRPDIPAPGKMESAQPAAPSALDRAVAPVPPELVQAEEKRKQVAELISQPETRAAIEQGMSEYTLLKQRYDMALELTEDPSKRERLANEFQRDAARIGVTVMQDAPGMKDAILHGLVQFPGISREDMQVLFPYSQTAQVLAAGQRVIAGAASGLTAPAIVLAPLLPPGGQAAAAGAFGVDMARQIPGQAKEFYEAAKSGDVPRIVESGGNLAATSVFATGALGHAQRELAPTKGQIVGDELRAFEDRTRTTELPTARPGPELLTMADPPTYLAAESAARAGMPNTAAATKDAAGFVQLPGPAPKEDLTGQPEAKVETAPEAETKGGKAPDTERGISVGPGAASPAEMDPVNDFTTGIKNAVTDAERASRGMPEARAAARRDFGQVWDEAVQRANDDPQATDDLIRELQRKPRALTDTEDAMLLHRQIDLQREFDRANRALAEAHANGDWEQVDAENLRVKNWAEQLYDLYEVNRKAGTETGRGLNARKMLADQDYSLANMVVTKQGARGGKPLSPDELLEITKLQKEIAEAQKRYDEHVAESGKRESELQAQLKAEQLRNEARGKVSDYIVNVAEKIAKGLDTRADAARARLKEKMGQLGSGVDPTILLDLAEIGASHIGRAGADFAKWSAKMIEDVGEWARPHLEKVFEESRKLVDGTITRAVPAKDRQKVTDRVTKKGKKEAGDAVGDKIKEKVAEGKLSDIGYYVQELAKNFVELGIRDTDQLIDAVHEELQKHIPGITRRETMDAISGYGKFKQLSKEEADVQLRQMKGEMQQLGKIEDMEKGVAPKKTGTERRDPSDRERQLIKKVNEMKKRLGFTVTDPATQLKSALETIKTHLRNQITDLEQQISSRTKIVKEKTPPPTDAEVDALRARRDELKKQFDEVFPKEPITEEQQFSRAKKALQKSLDHYEALLAGKEAGKPVQRGAKPKRFTNPELEAMRARREGLKSMIELFDELDPHVREEATIKSLFKSIDEYERRIKENDLSRPQGEKVSTPRVDALRARRDALSERLQELRKASPEGKAEALRRAEEAAQESLEALADEISRGDVEPKAKGPGVTSPKLEAIRAKRAELQKVKQEMRKATPGARAEALRRTEEKLQSSIDKLVDEINRGDIEPKGKKPGVTSPRVEALRAERADLLKVKQELRNALKPKKSREEIALKASKTRTANRIAELQEKIARGDFRTTPRVPVKPDAELTKLKSTLEGLKLNYRRGVYKDRMAQRSGFEKTLDTWVKIRRAGALSSLGTFAKLFGAAVFRAVSSPVEEIAGAALGKVLPRALTDKARLEAGFSWNAEKAALKGAVTKGLRDAVSVLRTGESELSKGHGRPVLETPTILDVFGHAHGAMKAPIKRAAYERAYTKLMEADMRRGIDITDEAVKARNAAIAYRAAERSIFLDDNIVVNGVNAALRTFERVNKETGRPNTAGKVLATIFRTLLPIVKVPSNIVAETYQYTGVPGATKLVNALRKGLDGLSEEQADIIMRELKKGSIGMPLMLLGFFAPSMFGGFYQHGAKKDPKDVKYGAVRVGGPNGTEIDSHLLHHPVMEVVQMGATIRQVAESRTHGKQRGLTAGALAGAMGLIEESPFMREQIDIAKAFDVNQRQQFFGELAKSVTIPQGVQWLARKLDTDRKGEPVNRKKASVPDYIKEGVPGLRETLPKK